MNDWIRRSVEIATNEDYLDQISEIYRIPYGLRRPINAQARQRIETLFNQRDNENLVRLLLQQQKFPFQDPFVGFLRVDDSAIGRNPHTLERLTQILHTMGLDAIIRGIEEPAQANRRLGALVRQWIRRLPYPRLQEAEFVATQGIAVLDGTDRRLMEFCNRVLQCGLDKGADIVAKAAGRYVVAEAKFITTPGGNQDKSFREVLRFIRGAQGNAIRVGVMDGVVWMHETGLYGTIRQVEETALTALLFERFLQGVQR